MPSPTLPADIKATLPDPNSTICGNMISALIRFPTLIYTWFAWAFTSTGNFSKQFINGSLPPGSITMSACLLTEDGTRLLADGRDVSQTDFPDLYAAIGTTYGTPAGPTTFKIPNMQAMFPVGLGSGGTATFPTAPAVSLGVKGGEDVHLLTATETGVPAHTHDSGNGTAWAILSQNISGGGGAGLTNGSSVSDTLTTGGVHGGAVAAVGHNNIPPCLGFYFYIIC